MKHKISGEQIQRLVSLRRKDVSFANIGRELGLHSATVSRIFEQVTAQGASDQPEPAVAPAATIRNRASEPLPAMHPDTWAAITTTWCSEWREQRLEA